MKSKESQLQQNCVTWFRLQYPEYKMLLFMIPNGGSRNVIEAINLKKQGVLAGVADLQLAIPNKQYHSLFIEMKFAKNKQQPSQIEFQKAVEKQGYKYALVYSFDEFMQLINDYLGNVSELDIMKRERAGI